MAESGSVQTQPPGCIKNETAETISKKVCKLAFYGNHR